VVLTGLLLQKGASLPLFYEGIFSYAALLCRFSIYFFLFNKYDVFLFHVTVTFLQDLNDRSKGSIVSMRDTTDAVHNFVLSQKLTTLLGNFPEVNSHT